MSATVVGKASGTKRKAHGGNKSTSNRSQSNPAGKKGTTSSVFSNKSGTPDMEITEENMTIYKAMQAKLKAQRKAAATSQDEGKLF
jgi:hypothetical protein